MPRDELRAVVAGREHDSAPPHSRMLPDLELDAVAQGSEAARLDDARRAQDGDAALYPQVWVEGLFGKGNALGYRNRHSNISRKAVRGAHLAHRRSDHRARRRVDGGRPHRLLEPGQRHAPHAHAAIDGNFRFVRGHVLAARSARARPRMFHARVHEHAVGHIGIVACVLSHGALGAPLADACVDHVRLDGQPAGGDDRHAADGLS